MEIRHLGWLALAGLVGPAMAQSVSIPAEYDKLIQSRTAVGTLGPDLFGDELNFYDGTVQFVQTDVSLPGNAATLPMTVSRRFVVKQDYYRQGAFGDWELEIPHLHGVFSTAGWVVPIPQGQPASAAQLRCSNYGPPPGVSGVGGGSFSASEFWNGSFLALPGGGGGELLKRGASTPAPIDGQSYPLVTKGGTALRCLPSLAASSSGSGEGFEALTPDGTRYRFDHMVLRQVASLFKATPYPDLMIATSAAASAPADRELGSGVVPMMLPDGYMMHRREVWILPTVVTDRIGNTLTYHWSSSEPWKLLGITANDGRSFSFTYLTGSTRVATVSDGHRTWTYTYQPIGSSTTAGRLSQVTLPDNTNWTFNLEPLRTVMDVNENAYCGEAGQSTKPTGTGTMTHPSGAQGSFTVNEKVLGRSHVPLDCRNYDPVNGVLGYTQHPAEFLSPALTRKALSGPGLANQIWTYSYGPANNCYQPGTQWPEIGIRCTTSSATTRTVSVTAPDNRVTRYTFGNRYQVDEGQLLKVEEGVSGSTALRTTTTTYALPGDGPYPNPVGLSLQPRNDGYLASRHTPERMRVITQQGSTFTWRVDNTCAGSTYCFDSRARPTKVIKSSAPSP